MKSAEEWVSLDSPVFDPIFHAKEDSVDDADWIETVKAIQLDAWKQGVVDCLKISKVQRDEGLEASMTLTAELMQEMQK